MTLVAICLVMP